MAPIGRAWWTRGSNGGLLAASGCSTPQALVAWWQQEYPVITDVDTNLGFIEEVGYEALGHFALPSEAWSWARKSRSVKLSALG